MKINIRNPFLVALLGFIFTVADATYVVQPSGAAVEVVQTDDGSWHPRADFVEGADGDLLPRSAAVEVVGSWYMPDDERLIHLPAFGVYHLRSECVGVAEDMWPVSICCEVDGTWHLRSTCCEVDDVWVLRSDCRETHDGTWALADDCTRVYADSTFFHYNSSNYEWYSEAQLEEARDNGEIEYVEHRDRYYTSDCVCWAADTVEFELLDDCTEFDGEYYTNRGGRVATDGNGDSFLLNQYGRNDDYRQCSDGEWWPTDDCHYCSSSGEWEYGDEDDCSCCNRGPSDNYLNERHDSPDPTYYSGRSGWLVGFEVEKCDIDGHDDEGDYVGSSPLFSGWELDSSCGVEGISHCYDPCDRKTIRKFLFHLKCSREYVNASWNSDCGGHINVSNSGLSNYELFHKFRVYAPLWYAVFRGRLNNSYCCNDKLIRHGTEKYSPVHRKPFGIEIRLPHAVKSDVVLRNRFQLVHLTARAIDTNLTFAEYVRSCKPFLLRRCYGGDVATLRQVLSLAGRFHTWFRSDGAKVHRSIRKYV